MAIHWTKELLVDGDPRAIYRGDGRDVEWTIMPPHGGHVQNCDVKISNLSARDLLQSGEYRKVCVRVEELRNQGRHWEAYRLQKASTIFNRDFIVTGSQAEGMAIAEAFEEDNPDAERVSRLLSAAGFVFSYPLGDGVLMFHRPIRRGAFSISISRSAVALHYDPPQSRFTYTVFRVRLDDSASIDRRLKSVWPKNICFPLRKAVSTAIMLADLRAKLKRPSQPLTADAFAGRS